jgi:hypothetical protein
MSFIGFFFIAFLLVTGPIWMTLLIFNLPVIVATYFAFFYTNVTFIESLIVYSYSIL